MKIRCKIERDGGTQVRIDDTNYHFFGVPGEHVAEVTNEDHARRFLNIPEAYEPFGVRYEEAGGAAPPIVLPVPVVADLPDRSEPPSGPDYNGLTRKQLEQAYFDKFQKKPHPRAKDSTIVEALIGG